MGNLTLLKIIFAGFIVLPCSGFATSCLPPEDIKFVENSNLLIKNFRPIAPAGWRLSSLESSNNMNRQEGLRFKSVRLLIYSKDANGYLISSQEACQYHWTNIYMDSFDYSIITYDTNDHFTIIKEDDFKNTQKTENDFKKEGWKISSTAGFEQLICEKSEIDQCTW